MATQAQPYVTTNEDVMFFGVPAPPVTSAVTVAVAAEPELGDPCPGAGLIGGAL
jgi:hypothetical protein